MRVPGAGAFACARRTSIAETVSGSEFPLARPLPLLSETGGLIPLAPAENLRLAGGRPSAIEGRSTQRPVLARGRTLRTAVVRHVLGDRRAGDGCARVVPLRPRQRPPP